MYRQRAECERTTRELLGRLAPGGDFMRLLDTALDLAMELTRSDVGAAVVVFDRDAEQAFARLRTAEGSSRDAPSMEARWRRSLADTAGPPGNGAARQARGQAPGACEWRGEPLFAASRAVAVSGLLDGTLGLLQVESTAGGHYTADAVRLLHAVGYAFMVAFERWQLQRHAAARGFDFQFVGADERLLDMERRIKHVAAAGASPVLIRGERGSGKELAAYAIHYHSQRRQKPFLPVNSAALSHSLYADDLFGHERGAFTGAESQREGLLRAAAGGTLFLDEIAELPLHVQASLLRFVDSGELQRIGSDKLVRVDVRIVAATNSDLEALVERGAFRADFYDRLNVLRLDVAPLRARTQDIPLLADYFLKRACSATGRFRRLCRDADCVGGAAAGRPACAQPTFYSELAKHGYPGNVRELRNLITRVAAMVDEHELGSRHVSEQLGRVASLAPDAPGAARADSPLVTPADVRLEQIVRQHILGVLERTHNNKSAAARLLGLPLTTLVNKMKRLGLTRDSAHH